MNASTTYKWIVETRSSVYSIRDVLSSRGVLKQASNLKTLIDALLFAYGGYTCLHVPSGSVNKHPIQQHCYWIQ